MLIDTHCHIHESDYPLPLVEVLKHAADNKVDKMILVGTSVKSSIEAIELASKHDNLFASVGVHPHDTQDGYAEIDSMAKESIVAIGEVGLDYYYTHSPREVQIEALQSQIQTALKNKLPIIFHVRNAFDDFWPIVDNFHGVQGVLHSFTDSKENLEKAFSRKLYVGVNGISTFTKDTAQQQLYATIPLERMLLETDAPFLTPVPYRGIVNEPAFVSEVAKFHARIRGIDPSEVASVTTANALALFHF